MLFHLSLFLRLPSSLFTSSSRNNESPFFRRRSCNVFSIPLSNRLRNTITLPCELTWLYRERDLVFFSGVRTLDAYFMLLFIEPSQTRRPESRRVSQTSQISEKKNRCERNLGYRSRARFLFQRREIYGSNCFPKIL